MHTLDVLFGGEEGNSIPLFGRGFNCIRFSHVGRDGRDGNSAAMGGSRYSLGGSNEIFELGQKKNIYIYIIY